MPARVKKNRAAAQPAARTPSISTRSGRPAEGKFIICLHYLVQCLILCIDLVSAPTTTRGRGRGHGRGNLQSHIASNIEDSINPNEAAAADEDHDVNRAPDGDCEDAPAGLSLQSPAKPRTRRPRQPRAVPESSRITRQSTRRKRDENGVLEDEVSPTKIVAIESTQPDGDKDESHHDEEVKPQAPVPKTTQNSQPSYPTSTSISTGGPQDESTDSTAGDVELTKKYLMETDKSKAAQTPVSQSPIPKDSEDVSAGDALPSSLSRKRKSIAAAENAETKKRRIEKDAQTPESHVQDGPATDTKHDESSQEGSFEEASLGKHSSPRLSRKRKSIEAQDETNVNSEDAESKRQRIEKAEQISEGQKDSSAHSGENNNTISAPPVRGGRGGYGARGGRGRGGGRGRDSGGRGRGRGRGGRGRGKSANRRGGQNNENDTEDEFWPFWDMAENWRESTPPPHPETQRIKDRQAELSALFQKIGQAQQGALALVADRSMDTLARDPDVHKNCSEFATVQQDLDWYEAKAVGILEAEYREKCLLAERMQEANVWIAKRTTARHMEELRENTLNLLMGEMMALIEGHQAAEDTEHPEYDGSDPEGSFQELVFPDDGTMPGQLERGSDAEEAYESLLEAANYIHAEESAGKPIGYE
ncbi:hypothetical protein N7461_007557 [Penicillium sp. DV-2018c]|nr:hypothetical protein N7461_007557 [Penicillium sp. DV-2018c]